MHLLMDKKLVLLIAQDLNVEGVLFGWAVILASFFSAVLASFSLDKKKIFGYKLSH